MHFGRALAVYFDVAAAALDADVPDFYAVHVNFENGVIPKVDFIDFGGKPFLMTVVVIVVAIVAIFAFEFGSTLGPYPIDRRSVECRTEADLVISIIGGGWGRCSERHEQRQRKQGSRNGKLTGQVVGTHWVFSFWGLCFSC